VNKTIVTLTAVVALTLAACGSGTSDTTTTEDTRGWSDEAFRDVMAYCQASDLQGSCASTVIGFRDGWKCSVEGIYILVDLFTGKRSLSGNPNPTISDVIPAGDCLEYPFFDE